MLSTGGTSPASRRRSLAVGRFSDSVRLQRGEDLADPGRVDTLTEFRWLLPALIAVFGLVQLLRILSIRVRNEIMVHELRVRTSKIRADHYRSMMLRHGMARMGAGGEPGGVEIIDDEPDAGPAGEGGPDGESGVELVGDSGGARAAA